MDMGVGNPGVKVLYTERWDYQWIGNGCGLGHIRPDW